MGYGVTGNSLVKHMEQIVGFPYARTESGDIIYENGLPKVNNSELVTLGNITPDWTGVLILHLSTKL